jgi:hypothetical protein
MCAKIFLFLLALALLVGYAGCRERTKVQAGNSRWQDSAAKWQEDLFNYAIDNLNQLDKNQNQETFFSIFRQIYALQLSAADQVNKEAATIDPLTAAWPETEMHRQIFDRLNQWVRIQKPPSDWKADPLVETLPAELEKLPLVENLSALEFSAFDVNYLQESVFLRDVALWARGDSLDDLSRAKTLFSWTIRNVQLEADEKERIPLFPWETLFFGRGTATERARVFILLARQQGLDAAVLALADPAENTPIARGIKPLQPWCTAVLIDNKAYLFDPALGVPIPAKDGLRRDAQGRLEIQPATLAEIVAEPSLLKQLDLDDKNTYPVKAEDLEKIVALVDASPASLSCRMRLVESRLAGKNKMVVTTSATAQGERWKKSPNISESRLWLKPCEIIKRRSQLNPEEIAGQLGEFLRFYALPGAPLAKGRLLQIKGQFSGQEGAIGFFQSARPTKDQLGYLSELPSVDQLDKIKKDLAKVRSDMNKAGNDPTAAPPPMLTQQKAAVDNDITNVELAKMTKRLQDEYTEMAMKIAKFKSEEEKNLAKEYFQQRALQMMMRNIDDGKQDATYWLGLLTFERGNYNSAEDYFSKRILEKFPKSLWRDGAFYNLALTLEAAGEIERAVMIYQSDPEAPDHYGRQLRARWLQEKEKAGQTPP